MLRRTVALSLLLGTLVTAELQDNEGKLKRLRPSLVYMYMLARST